MYDSVNTQTFALLLMHGWLLPFQKQIGRTETQQSDVDVVHLHKD